MDTGPHTTTVMSNNKERTWVSNEIIVKMNANQLASLMQEWRNRFDVRTVMTRLREIGLGWNFTCKRKKTLLHFAAEEGDCEAIKMLLDDKSCNVNDYDLFIITETFVKPDRVPINYACLNNHLEAVKLLVEAGADIKDEKKMLRLIDESILTGESEIFDYLLGLDESLKKTLVGRESLHTAAMVGNLAVFDKLLALGLDPFRKTTDQKKFSVLHEACMHGKSSAMIKRIMDLGLDPHDMIGVIKRSAIDCLAEKGTRETMLTMMSYGVVEEKEHNRYLSHAVSFSNLETARLLLEKGANPNVIVPLDPFYPIQRAVDNCRPAMIELLLEFGADIHVNTRKGESLLTMALKVRDPVPVIECLCRNGIDVNEPILISTTNSLPLHLACAVAGLPVIQKLIDLGAKVDAVDAEGQTALHRAADLGRIEAVQALILRGANANIKDKLLNSPLDYAKNPKIWQMLVDAGAEEITISARIQRLFMPCFS